MTKTTYLASQLRKKEEQGAERSFSTCDLGTKEKSHVCLFIVCSHHFKYFLLHPVFLLYLFVGIFLLVVIMVIIIVQSAAGVQIFVVICPFLTV